MTTSPDDYLALWWHGDVRLPLDDAITWARRQRLLPLLRWRARQEGWTLPKALMQAIDHNQMVTALNQALVRRQLAAIEQIADALDIPIVLVKGAAVATAYPEPWMRPFGDIDLLIQSEAMTGFLAAMAELGYTPPAWAAGRQTRHYPPLMPPGEGVPVEVHTVMSREHGRVRFDLRQWEANLEQLPDFPGIWAPGQHDHLVYIAYHATVHHDLLMGLHPYADLGFLSETWTKPDWERAVEIAEDLGIGRALALSVALTGWFWQRDIVGTAALDAPDPSILMLAESTATMAESGPWVPHLWRDSPDYSFRGLLTFARKTLLGDPDQLQEYTARERLRFRLLRPFKLIQNHGASLFRLLRGDPEARAKWRTQRDLQGWLRQS